MSTQEKPASEATPQPAPAEKAPAEKPAPKAAAAPAPPPPDIEDVEDVTLENLVGRSHVMANEGYRFVTLTCLDSGDVFEIYYHFDKDAIFRHLLLRLPKGTDLPTITNAYFCAFLAENELQSLFGIKVDGLAIDYAGKMLVVDDGGPPPLLKSSYCGTN